ncbi:hypothetical protein ACFL96_07695 [Thermoproteota archaeon]
MEIRKRLHRKGVFYTIIAITLLMAVIFSSTLSYQYKYREQRAIIETRVNTMENFIKDLEDDTEKGVTVAGYRAIVGMTNYVIDNMQFIDDVDQRFQELFYYGTIYGNSSFVMENNTFLNWTYKMEEEAEKIGIDVDLTLLYFNVKQTGPWSIEVTVNVSAELTDLRGTASWGKTYQVVVGIPIDGFEDPVYAVKTSNAVPKTINRTIYENDYVSGNDTTNLQLHMNGSYYTEFNASPSFFMRFEGDFNASEYGIESIVNKEDVSIYWPCPEGTSNVDTLYWQCSSAQTWTVNNMQSWFYLDNQTGDEGRHKKYEVSNLI